MITKWISPVWIALAACAMGAPAGHPEMLVSTEWLASHISDPGLVIVHVGRDRKAYDAGHIAGAQFLAWSEITTTRDGIANELPAAADLVGVFERLGGTNGSRFVMYADTFSPMASRAFFTLDYLGLGERAALLDGGIERWRAEKRPLTQDAPAKREGRIEAHVKAEAVIGMEAVRRLVGAGDMLIVDARSSPDYRSGRIPGARQAFWMDQLAAGEAPVLRAPDDLRKQYEAAGLKPGQTAVVYCNSGVQATFDYFTLRYLGYAARLYDGSMSEWTRFPDAPVEKD